MTPHKCSQGTFNLTFRPDNIPDGTFNPDLAPTSARIWGPALAIDAIKLSHGLISEPYGAWVDGGAGR